MKRYNCFIKLAEEDYKECQLISLGNKYLVFFPKKLFPKLVGEREIYAVVYFIPTHSYLTEKLDKFNWQSYEVWHPLLLYSTYGEACDNPVDSHKMYIRIPIPGGVALTSCWKKIPYAN